MLLDSSYYVFGDSHARCFLTLCEVFYFPASSAKGLCNQQSISGVNYAIINKLKQIPDNSNIIMFFGKVDMDFILNYKYNTSNIENYEKYIIDLVNSYIEFIKINTSLKNVFICELPITHINDEYMLKILHIEAHLININSRLPSDSQNIYSKFTKVIPYNERLNYYRIFNEELVKKCKINNFTLLEINKYFINKNGNFEIPLKYINTDNLDHHLNDNIYELYLESLELIDK